MDRDRNGVLSPEEIALVIQEKMGFDENMARHLVQMFDQNKDGSLDKTEFIQLWTSMFGQWEGNSTQVNYQRQQQVGKGESQ